MTEWRFEWLRSWDEIRSESFASRWQELVDASPGARIFSEPAMVRAWLDTKGAALGVGPAFCLASSGDGGEVVLPFCSLPHSWRNTWERRVVAAGQPHFDYQDPSARGSGDGAVDWSGFWRALEDEVRERIHWFDMVVVLRLTEKVAPGNAAADPAEISPYMKLDGCTSLDNYLSGRSGNHRNDVRRRFRRLREKGEVRLHVLDADDGKAARVELNRMAQAYEAVHAGAKSEGLFRCAGTREFYERLIEGLLPAGLVHFSLLEVGGEPAAWHFGFLHRGVLHWYKPTYSPAFADLSPGKVHLGMLVEEGISRGWRMIDLGGGVEVYKSRWTDDAVELRQIQWRTSTVRSRFCAAARRLAGRGGQ